MSKADFEDLHEEMMKKPRVKLQLKSAFGISTSFADFSLQSNLEFLPSHVSNQMSLLYPIGKHIGVRDLKS